MKKQLTSSEKSLLLAMCLGDGCLRKPQKSCNVQFECAHSIKLLEYCTWKRDLIFKILGGFKPPKISNREIKLNGYDIKYQACRFCKTDKYFTYLRKLLYPGGVKVITREVLDKLTIQGIAIWFMDDGSLYTKLNHNLTKSICFDLRISTDSFSKEENEIICNYFKEAHGINFYTFCAQPKRSKYKWCIRANKEAALKFIDLIEPYVIPSMKYKVSYKRDNNSHDNGASLLEEEIV